MSETPLETHQTIAELQKEVAQLRELIFEIQAAEVGSTEHSKVLEEIARSGMSVLRAEASGVYLVDYATSEFVFETIVGGGGSDLISTRMPLTQGIPGLVAATGQPQIVFRPEFKDREREIVNRTGFEPKSVLCVPLTHAGKLIGVLGFYDKQESAAFDYEDIGTAMAFGSIAGEALAESLARQKRAKTLRSGEEAEGVNGRLAQSRRFLKLTHDLALTGETEFKLCVDLLEILEAYIVQARVR